VLDASCQPLEGALVDVWHADVDGDYSAFSDGSGGAGDGGPGTTFLRGSQLTNAEGIVEFVTNYPGWYTGRAVHIHFKVHTEGGEVLTSQMYFPEDVTDEVHAGGVYASHGRRDTFNDSDGIAGDAEESGLLLAIRDDATDRGAGKLGLLVVGIGG
jgi:protocatechuate 3,4-dioxygenase beta subunit